MLDLGCVGTSPEGHAAEDLGCQKAALGLRSQISHSEQTVLRTGHCNATAANWRKDARAAEQGRRTMFQNAGDQQPCRRLVAALAKINQCCWRFQLEPAASSNC